MKAAAKRKRGPLRVLNCTCRVFPFDVCEKLTATSVDDVRAQLKVIYPQLRRVQIAGDYLNSPQWDNCVDLQEEHWDVLPDTTPIVLRVDLDEGASRRVTKLTRDMLDRAVWAMNSASVSVNRMVTLLTRGSPYPSCVTGV